MSWYSQMFKSYEVARDRNRREQKRLQIEMGQKYGPKFVAQYHMCEINREQRLIETELERIRKGIHKKPKHAVDSNPNSAAKPSTDAPTSHVLTVVSPRQQRHHPFAFPEVKRFEREIDTRVSAEENQLFQAILLLKTNPAELVPILNAHARSSAYFDTLERISPRLTPELQKPFVPRYISNADSVTSNERATLRKKYESLLQRKNSFLKRSRSTVKRKTPLPSNKLSAVRNRNRNKNNSPVSNNKPYIVEPNIEIQQSTPLDEDTVVPLPSDAEQLLVLQSDEIALAGNSKHDQTLTHDDDPNILPFDQELDPIVDHRRLLSTGSALNSDTPIREKQFAETEHSTPVPRSSHFGPLDCAHFTVDAMSNTRGQASTEKHPLERKLSQSTDDDNAYTATRAIPALDRKISSTKMMFPPTDAETYNADGSKRTVHNLPAFDESYDQASKARYIRTRDKLERDTELSLKEIFDK